VVPSVLAVCDRPVDSIFVVSMFITSGELSCAEYYQPPPGEADTCQRCHLSEPSFERIEGRSLTALKTYEDGIRGLLSRAKFHYIRHIDLSTGQIQMHRSLDRILCGSFLYKTKHTSSIKHTSWTPPPLRLPAAPASRLRLVTLVDEADLATISEV
jgi:hypothetical protein